MKTQVSKVHSIDMTSGSILPKLLLFTLPLMFSSILQLLFNAADIVVVGRFCGEESLAAVGSTSSLINLLTNLFIGLSVGTNVLTAHFFGSKEKDKLHDAIHTSIAISLISGVLLTIVGVCFTGTILEWMSTPPEVLPLATLYLRIYFLGMVATMLYNFCSAILRAVGDTQRPLYYLLFSGCINVLLNLIFVIYFHMNVAGVGLATVLSQCISAFLVLRCLMLEQEDYRITLSHICVKKEYVKRILRIGLPAGLQGTVFSLSNVVIQSSINSFGSVVMAGSAASGNIEGFVYVSMNAFHQAAISFVSQNMGAGKWKRMTRIAIWCLICVTITGLVLGLSTVFFGPMLLGIYSPKANVIEAGMVRLTIVCGTYFLCGIMDVMAGVMRGYGYSVMPMLVSLIGACGLRLFWIFTFFKLPVFHTPQMLYMTYPVSWILTASVHIICYFCIKRRFPKEDSNI
ncbi:MAG: MATE family efflux transporter [Lachnospiraceae bacterium]